MIDATRDTRLICLTAVPELAAMAPARLLRLTAATAALLFLPACGSSDTGMADTAMPAMSPGVVDTIIRTDTVIRGSMDTTTRDTLRTDTTRRDTTRDTVPR